MTEKKVLIVDDDPKIIKIVEHSLRQEGYTVYMATDGEQALDMTEKVNPDLLILDLMLPKIEGFEVCKKIKSVKDIPVIILSARGEEVDKVVGFTLGADDYQTKPFSPTELVMRVKAVLRRYRQPAGPDGKRELITCRGLEVNLKDRTVKRDGNQVELTAKEFNLLWYLAVNSPRVFTRQQLLEALWEPDFYGDENTLTVHIRRLREKIERNPNKPEYIKTFWGVGYKFESGEETIKQTP
ncbi:MAG: DNA-binding response regulator [Firmicutes bacterium HGW-Firmicutes-14]|nr:MAG: DNA-binding response regulator [Firmicutes bacterium HGW-Firmicutes-14]